MRTLPLFIGISSLLLAACGDDSGGKAQDAAPQDGIVIHDTTPTPDSPPADADPNLSFSCYQNTAPTTAPANISISGTVTTFSTGSGSGIVGAPIKACKGDCTGNNILAMTESGAAGAFDTGAIATNDAPVPGYLIATKPPGSDAAYFKTLVYPAAPLAASLANIPIPLITQDNLDQIAIAVGTQDADKGVMALLVSDCSSPYMGVIGASVSVKVGGTEYGSDAFDVGGLLGAQAAGTYLITNVPPGTATVTVTYAGMTFLPNVVTVEAMAATAVQIRPGY
ncbi:MAG TPA: carboxypeptidase-like regulatory domain-containing protein [Kofleriaceae bacterium]